MAKCLFGLQVSLENIRGPECKVENIEKGGEESGR